MNFIFQNFQGDYEGKALFYSKANPDVILGCVNMAFSVAAWKDELQTQHQQQPQQYHHQQQQKQQQQNQ